MRTLFLFLLLLLPVAAAPKKVAVFVALCDNASQGILPVPAKIGDGDKPAENLYWGCDDGIASCFRRSKSWKLQRKEVPEDKRILERLVFINESSDIELTAEAWKGSEIRACLSAFELALVSGKQDLCAYLGHNVLMDAMVNGPIDPPVTKAAKPCDAIVLCCMSESYFKERLTKLGAKPVLLTTQYMYPGSFILRDCLPLWAKGKPHPELRTVAGAAYARNQKISQKAATGVFSASPDK